MRAVLPEVTQVWKKDGATLESKVMVRIIIIVIVSAEGAKAPSIMVWSPKQLDLNDGKIFTTMEWLMVFVKVPL